MTQEQLKAILEEHLKWLKDNSTGKRADLSDVVLGNTNLSNADLRNADLSNADLRNADLSNANLNNANLRNANLNNANLRNANLRNANLIYANLRNANLNNANLIYANLRNADLYNADLSNANLHNADLNNADLSDVVLGNTNLSNADLRNAILTNIKIDFFRKLALVKNEVPGLYDLLVRGKINGAVYKGDCACFVGSVAKLRNEDPNSMSCELQPSPSSATEKWFFAIKTGDTPKNNPVSKITRGWMREFMKENGIAIPKYKVLSSLKNPELLK